MQRKFYSIVVCLVLNVIVYFNWGTSVFLIVFILSLFLLILLIKNSSVKDFKKIYNKGKGFLSSKKNYRKANKETYHHLHKNRMSSLNKFNLSGKQDCSFDSGLLSDYESRRARVNIKSGELPSPVRSIFKSNNHDENSPFKQTFSPISCSVLSPIRAVDQNIRSSPLTHSKRHNVNLDQSNNDTFLTSRHTFHDDSSRSPSVLPRQRVSFNTPDRMLRIGTTANSMGLNQFPWFSPKYSVMPLPPSPTQRSANCSPVNTSDSTTPKRTRVKVRLTGPNRSDLSADSSSQDINASLDDACTTKSVIQVLKEISRKRALAPSEEEQQQDAKRHPGHNLYVSRLETDEENPIPTRTNGEDDRKRYREPDWDSPPNMTGPKRRKKNHVVNNEILSSLSSSIGLIRQVNIAPVAAKPKKTTSVGTQVSLLKDTIDEKDLGKSNAEKPVKEVKEAATMPDPPPPPRPRSPVKEKVVTDLNGILKSALSKFKIQPKEDSKNMTCISTGAPSGNTYASSNPEPIKVPEVTSASSILPPMGLPTQSNQTLNKEPLPAFGSQTSSLTLPVSSPPKISFGSSQLPLGVTSEKVKTSNGTVQKQDILSFDKKTEISKNDTSNAQPSGFNFNPTPEAPKSDSTFVFGQPSSPISSLSKPTPGLQSANIQSVTFAQSPPQLSSVSQSNINLPSTTSMSSSNPPSSTPQSPFKLTSTTPQFSSAQLTTGVTSPFKIPEATSSSNTANTTSTTSFSFGVTTTQGTKSIDQASTAVVPAQSQSQNSLIPSNSTVVTDTAKSEPFKFGTSGFNFQGKANEPSKEEKKDSNTTGLFTFGKSDSTPAIGTEKTSSVNKPFQFGGGGFAFGQSSQTKEANINPAAQTSTAVSSSGSDKPVFSFSANSQKKEEPAGGFSFKLPSTAAPTTIEQKPVFAFSGSSTTTAATTSANTGSTSSGISTTTNAKPIFPTSIFGNSATTTQAGNNTSVAIAKPTAVPATNTFGSSSVFSSPSNIPGKAFNATTTTTSAPTFGSVTSVFSSDNKTIFGNPTTAASSSSPFGAVSNNQTGTSSIFGSNAGSAVGSTSAFSSNNTTLPSFGTITNNAPAFGNTASVSTPAFGAPTTTTTSFASTTTPTFGSTASVGGSTTGFSAPSGNNAPTFGSVLATTTTPSFGVTNTTTPSFGATNTTTPSFGGLQTSTPSIFGSSSTTATTAPFGGGVASTTSFGSSTATGTSGSSLFGNTNSAPAFGGNTTTPAPTFGTQSQGFGAQSGTTFGSTPAFGQSTPAPFGGQTTFGNQPGGSTFGSTPAFGSGSSAFSATPTPAAPAFGSSTPAFGSTPAFASQDASKPFTFNAPTAQPGSGGFNFTASQPQPQPSSSTGGLFQFGASSNTQANQPFQFNAAQPNSSVGGTGQQMFSIGSGSTAPRRVTTAARRKK